MNDDKKTMLQKTDEIRDNLLRYALRKTAEHYMFFDNKNDKQDVHRIVTCSTILNIKNKAGVNYPAPYLITCDNDNDTDNYSIYHYHNVAFSTIAKFTPALLRLSPNDSAIFSETCANLFEKHKHGIALYVQYIPLLPKKEYSDESMDPVRFWNKPWLHPDACVAIICTFIVRDEKEKFTYFPFVFSLKDNGSIERENPSEYLINFAIPG